MSKRCVIIGSGLGGLSCGVMLSKAGYEVTVLEQGLRAGGCLQCFTRKGIKFETGMHFIGSAERGQILYRLLTYLDVMSRIKLQPLDRDGYDRISLQGDIFKIANGREGFIENLSERFPHQVKALNDYFDLVQRVAQASSVRSMCGRDVDLSSVLEYQTRSINEVLETVVQDALLRNVLVGNLPLYAARYDKTPFSTHAFITDFYNRSAFRIVGGSETVADALTENIIRNGGRVLTGKKAIRVECDDRAARAVVTEDGEVFEADTVIAAIHPMRAVELLRTKLIRPAYRARIASLAQTTSAFTLYLGFKENAVPYMNHNFYSYAQRSPWNCENYDEKSWPKGYLYMHQCHRDAPRYAQSGEIISYMDFKETEPWFGTRIGHRGKAYEDFKRRKAEKLLDAVERDFPGLRSRIADVYMSTPLTYRDYTGTEAGSLYGTAPDVQSSSGHVSHKTRIPNFFLAGQNVNSHGILGVLVGSIVCCSELLGAEYIYKHLQTTES